jgi:hypothetical protein
VKTCDILNRYVLLLVFAVFQSPNSIRHLLTYVDASLGARLHRVTSSLFPTHEHRTCNMWFVFVTLPQAFPLPSAPTPPTADCAHPPPPPHFISRSTHQLHAAGHCVLRERAVGAMQQPLDQREGVAGHLHTRPLLWLVVQGHPLPPRRHLLGCQRRL